MIVAVSRSHATAQREGDGFVAYDQLAQDEVQALANSVNALAEPLSRLTAAVLS